MAHLKVRLKLRVTLADGKRQYFEPVYNGNNTLKKFCALVDGEEQAHKKGVYTLIYREHGKQRTRFIKNKEVGNIPVIKQTLEARLKGIKLKLIPDEATVSEEQNKVTARGQQLLQAAATAYLSKVKTMKGPKTYSAYSGAVKGFVKGCATKNFDDLKDPKAAEAAIIAYWEQLHLRGDSDRYVSNKIIFLRTFFLKSGLPWPLKKVDMPSYTKKVVKMYNPAELIELMTAATADEYDLFQFFLGTGARDEEVQTAYWHNVDFVERKFYVRAKPELGFRTKSHEERGIPISDELVALLKARRERFPDTRLIFPSPSGGCETHFLRKLKKLAFAAGLNCGGCRTGIVHHEDGHVTGGESCADFPVCEHWKLHRFRKTFATLHYRSGKVTMTDLQKWLGHKDLKTTVLYLADADDDSPEMRATINNTFAFAKVQRATALQKPTRRWRAVAEMSQK